MKKLKAYMVREDGEGNCCIVFATNNATARREGAEEICSGEWEAVESCRRAAEFDQYTPGPVPATVLIDSGWWMTCRGCEVRVDADNYEAFEKLDDEDAEPPTPVDADDLRNVYCCQACKASDEAARRLRLVAGANLLEAFEARFTGATVVGAYADGPRLESRPERNGSHCSSSHVDFRFPGGKYTARWYFGDSLVTISKMDLDALHSWRGTA